MEIMELLGLILLALAIYVAAIYIVTKITLDKLGARSGLFAAGIVTMFTGFIWNKIVEYSAVVGGYWYFENGEPPFMYYVLFYGFLIMGLSGIVMMAVDILKAVNELHHALERRIKNPSAASKEKSGADDEPTWKYLVE